MRTERFASLVEMLQYRAAVSPGERVYTFLTDGETEGESLTYGALDVKARAIAATLSLQGVAPGDRAILLFPPSLDFISAFFGALYAGVIAVPCYPPHPSQISRALPRLLAIASDAGASVVLAPAQIVALAPDISGLAPPLGKIPWIATDLDDHDSARHWRGVGLAADTLAFLQYTSGSTATPRGVMVSHGNLLHNLAYMNYGAENDATTVAVSWLPVIHDMGLIEGILAPVFAGYPTFLMAPTAFLQRPIRWLRAISKYRATNSGGPNFAYDLCVRKITAEQRKTLDLSSWRVAYNGAEPIQSETLAGFHRLFAEQGFRWRSFYPVYGLAEATLVVSTGRLAYTPVFHDADAEALARGYVRSPDATRGVSANAQTTLVSSGQVACGTTVEIVNPNTCTPCAERQIGEIWISSPSVTRGYWGRPAETTQTFEARVANHDARTFLRSGDLGVCIEGELYVVGRLKDVIIVRGLNYYPQDLETTVEQRIHPLVRAGCTAAFAVTGHSDERVVVAVEIDPREVGRASNDRARIHSATALSPDVRAILDGIGEQILAVIAEQHGIRLHAVAILPPGGIPKTSSGKLCRYAAAQAFSRNELNEIVRRNGLGQQPTPAARSRLMADA